MACVAPYGLLIGLFGSALVGCEEPQRAHPDFHLFFSTAGLGSQLGSLQQTFRVDGEHFSYTLEQNSSYGTRTKEDQDVCGGVLRGASMDSIIALARSVGDSTIYRTDPDVMSGSISTLIVKSQGVHVEFTLHNDSDPIADQIISLLNSNIPIDKEKLFILDPS